MFSLETLVTKGYLIASLALVTLIAGCGGSDTFKKPEEKTVTIGEHVVPAGSVCAGVVGATLIDIQVSESVSVDSDAGNTDNYMTQLCEISGVFENRKLHLPAINSGYRIQWIIVGDVVVTGSSAGFVVEDGYVLKAREGASLTIGDGADFDVGFRGVPPRTGGHAISRDFDVGLRIEPYQSGGTWNGLTLSGGDANYSQLKVEKLVLMGGSLTITNVNDENTLSHSFKTIQIVDSPASALNIINSAIDLDEVAIVNAGAAALDVIGPALPRFKRSLFHTTADNAISVEPSLLASPGLAKPADSHSRLVLVNSSILGAGSMDSVSASGIAVSTGDSAVLRVFNSVVLGFNACFDSLAAGAQLRNVALACDVLTAGETGQQSDAGKGIYFLSVEPGVALFDGFTIPALDVQSRDYFPFDVGGDSEFPDIDLADPFYQGALDAGRFFGFLTSESDTGETLMNIGFALYQGDPSERWYVGNDIGIEIVLPVPVSAYCGGLGSLSSARRNVSGESARICVLARGLALDGLNAFVADNPDTEADESGRVVWVVSENIVVGDGNPDEDTSSFTLDAGARLLFFKGVGIVVNRDGQFVVEGTATEPVVLSSFDTDFALAEGILKSTGEVDDDNRDIREPVFNSEWRGVVVNGSAPNNRCNGETPAEAPCLVDGEFTHGGDDNTRVNTRIQHMHVYEADVGLTLNSVSAASALDHLVLGMNVVGGLIIDGGAPSVRDSRILDNAFGGIHWKNGYTGVISKTVVSASRNQSVTDPLDNSALYNTVDNIASPLVFGESHSADSSVSPRSNPLLANVTLVYESTLLQYSNRQILHGFGPQLGLRLANGSGVNIYNSIISASDACIDIADAETREFLMSHSHFKNVFFDCEAAAMAELVDSETDFTTPVLQSTVLHNTHSGRARTLASQVDELFTARYFATKAFGPSDVLIYDTSAIGASQSTHAPIDTQAYPTEVLQQTTYYGAVPYEHKVRTSLCSSDPLGLPDCTEESYLEGTACSLSTFPTCTPSVILSGQACVVRAPVSDTAPSFYMLRLSISYGDFPEAYYPECTAEQINNYNPLTGVISGSDSICYIPRYVDLNDGYKSGDSGTIANYEQAYFDNQSPGCKPKLAACSSDNPVFPCFNGDDPLTPASLQIDGDTAIANCASDISSLCIEFTALGTPEKIQFANGHSMAYVDRSLFADRCDGVDNYPCVNIFPDANTFASVWLNPLVQVPSCIEQPDATTCAEFLKSEEGVFNLNIKGPAPLAICDNAGTTFPCLLLTNNSVERVEIDVSNSIPVCRDGEDFNVCLMLDDSLNPGYFKRNGRETNVLLSDFLNWPAECGQSPQPVCINRVFGIDNIVTVFLSNDERFTLAERTLPACKDNGDTAPCVVFDDDGALIGILTNDQVFSIAQYFSLSATVGIPECDDATGPLPCLLINGDLGPFRLLLDAEHSALFACSINSATPCFSTEASDNFNSGNITITTAAGQITLGDFAEDEGIDLTPTPEPDSVAIPLCTEGAGPMPCVIVNPSLGIYRLPLTQDHLLFACNISSVQPCFTSEVTENFTDLNIQINTPDGAVNLRVFAENEGINLAPEPEPDPVPIALCTDGAGPMPCVIVNPSLGIYRLPLTQNHLLFACNINPAQPCFTSEVTENFTDLNIQINTPDGAVNLRVFAENEGINLVPEPEPDPVSIALCTDGAGPMPCVIVNPSLGIYRLPLTQNHLLFACNINPAQPCFTSEVTENFTDLNIQISTADGEVSLRAFAKKEGITLH
ncbi:putative lipoprotein [Teredinibacter turnerae T7901]|uniref:Lipoprotein n=1 Tax=Teredinibacter turnerae (strain ATCC 39867 / T7901) TaxID=377629 RepID=C5BN99_TERTT|nr:hypothetical protein [Teredinibacter turnerae]ACR11169.1 putative lipoprotein [Teredinibacter turnerae T7901]